jgi:predicted transcriptional regulator
MGKVERSILEILNFTGEREIYQSDLVRQTGYSRSRVSEVLSSLEERGLIRRAPLGKNFKVIPVVTPGKKKTHAMTIKAHKKNLILGIIRASEYPFVLPFEKLLRERMGITLQFVLYDNGIDLVRDLSQFRLDIGIAPVLTHFVFHSIGSPIKMVAPAGSGGATILVNQSSRRSGKGEFKVATTKLSTMEMMLRSSMNSGDVPKNSVVNYYPSPKQMIGAALLGEVDAACMWEPYSTILQKKRGNFKRFLEYEGSSDHENICCALAAGNHIEADLLRRVARVLLESIDMFRKNPTNYIPSYSSFMRYDEKLMRAASKKYSYPLEIDYHELASQFERAGIGIPLPSSVKEAVFQAN